MRGVRGVRKSIYQIWLSKGLGLGLLYLCFQGFQEEISSEEASTLQIGSVAFPPVNNFILAIDYFTKMGIKTVPQRPYSPDVGPYDFGYSLSSEAVVMRQLRRGERLIDTLTQEDFYGAFQKLLERYSKCIEDGGGYFEGD